MPDALTVLPAGPHSVGIATDHGGFELKNFLVQRLREAGHEVLDFGDRQPRPRR